MGINLDKVKEAMENYIGSEEHKKAIKKMEHDKFLKKRNIERIHNMSVEERSNFIEKVYNKYRSNEYIERELKAGYYEARNSLYDVILDYGVIYGKLSSYNLNEHFPEEQYDIDGKFIVGIMYGQGSYVYVIPIEENEVVPHIISNDEVEVYKPNGELLIKTDSELMFDDIRVQIAEKHLSGYYIIFKGEKREIKQNGYVEFPKGLFNKSLILLSTLIRLRGKENITQK